VVGSRLDGAHGGRVARARDRATSRRAAEPGELRFAGGRLCGVRARGARCL